MSEIKTFYDEHKRALKSKLKKYSDQLNSHDNLYQNSVFTDFDKGVTKHNLRYYQKEALFTLDYLFGLLQQTIKNSDEKNLLKNLFEEVADNVKAPFMGFEMATGSGKTEVMGACMYLLKKRFGINNFLIITPPSTDIYKKTINNFTIGNKESVWSDSKPMKYNLITGDNYSLNGDGLGFNTDIDTNVFIFNISKFGKNAINTDKPWETARWKDKDGNSISIREYLRQNKLVIITDEAHHAQSPASYNIIKNFIPEAVLEFTATAVEGQMTNNKEQKRAQTIVYKYDIKQFLEDGYGKLIRAIGMPPAEQRRKRGEKDLSDSDKQKIITLMLVHILKKESVNRDQDLRGAKPLAFIKVKDLTVYARDVVYNYIENDLINDKENLEIVLSKIKTEKWSVVNAMEEVLQNKFNYSLENILAEFDKIAKNTICYDGTSTKEENEKFENIRTNKVEIVVYVKKLDEGIDLPHIYTMAVINDNDTNDLRISVKQIIGRGVRLGKAKRTLDEESNNILKQAERLHIISDSGQNFIQVIEQIQKEFGLNDKYFGSEQEEVEVINKVKSKLLENKYIPRLKAKPKIKEGVNLIELLTNLEKIINDYCESNCFALPGTNEKVYIPFVPQTFFTDINMFDKISEIKQNLQQLEGSENTLVLDDKDLKGIYSKVLSKTSILPDTDLFKKIFLSYKDKLNSKKLKYFISDESDSILAKNKFKDTFVYFIRNYIEKQYFKLDFNLVDDGSKIWDLKEEYTEYSIVIPKDQIANTNWKSKDPTNLKNMIQGGYHFYGYESSAYDYNKFDSYTEKKVSDYFDLQKAEDGKSFWIRNNRQIFFEYGSKKYFPDFLIFHNKTMYIVEAKGEIYSDTQKNILLEQIDQSKGIGDVEKYKHILAYSGFIDSLENGNITIEDFILGAVNYQMDLMAKNDLKKDDEVEDDKKFTEYLPVYSIKNAFKKFVDKKEVKNEGWLLKKGSAENFMIQVKNSTVNDYNDLTYIKLSLEVGSDINDKTGLVYYPKIEDEGYGEGYALRKIKLVKNTTLDGMFEITSYDLVLYSENEEYADLEFKNIEQNNFKVIGIFKN